MKKFMLKIGFREDVFFILEKHAIKSIGGLKPRVYIYSTVEVFYDKAKAESRLESLLDY